MFTGLVQALGTVVSRTPDPVGARLVIDPRDWPHRPQPGASIAVNGCCLTHAPGSENRDTPASLAFDVVHQTLDRTTLGALKPGDPVNLESCLTPSTPIGGHFVQGHIDGVGAVENISTAAGEHRIIIRTDERLIRYIIPTGSVAVDGVSLTIAAVDPASRTFAVALIPTTLRATTLGRLQHGGRVNIETDILSRTVVHYLENFRTSVNAPSG